VGGLVDPQRLPQHVVAAGEPSLPRAVAEEDDPRKCSLILAREGPAERGPDADRLEEAGHQLERRHELGLFAAGDRRAACCKRGHPREALVERPPVLDIRIGRDVLHVTRPRVGRPDEDEPIRVGVGQRPQQHGAEQAEDRGIRADAETERENRDARERRVPAQHARADAQVLHEMVERGESRAVPVVLPDLREAAEPDERLAPRLVRRHSGAQVVVDVHVQVALKLRVELGLVRPRHDRTGEPCQPRPERSHDEASPGEKNRAMIPVVRSQSRASRRSCRRPPRVSR
jgi:hypothetical protein